MVGGVVAHPTASSEPVIRGDVLNPSNVTLGLYCSQAESTSRPLAGNVNRSAAHSGEMQPSSRRMR